MSVPLRIEELWAWVSLDPVDNQEGVIGVEMRDPLGRPDRTVFVPMVGADRERIESYRSYVENIVKTTGVPARLIRYAKVDEELEILTP